MEQRTQRTTVLLEGRGTVGVEAHVDAVTPKAFANRPHQSDRIARVVDNVEGRDEVELAP